MITVKVYQSKFTVATKITTAYQRHLGGLGENRLFIIVLLYDGESGSGS